jgi:hypothetical protein
VVGETENDAVVVFGVESGIIVGVAGFVLVLDRRNVFVCCVAPRRDANAAAAADP